MTLEGMKFLEGIMAKISNEILGFIFTFSYLCLLVCLWILFGSVAIIIFDIIFLFVATLGFYKNFILALLKKDDLDKDLL